MTDHLENEQLLEQYYNRYGGHWIYPDMLDSFLLVNPYFHRSKIIDQLAANSRPLVSEYPAGINVYSRLAAPCWNIKPEDIISGD